MSPSEVFSLFLPWPRKRLKFMLFSFRFPSLRGSWPVLDLPRPVVRCIQPNIAGEIACTWMTSLATWPTPTSAGEVMQVRLRGAECGQRQHPGCTYRWRITHVALHPLPLRTTLVTGLLPDPTSRPRLLPWRYASSVPEQALPNPDQTPTNITASGSADQVDECHGGAFASAPTAIVALNPMVHKRARLT